MHDVEDEDVYVEPESVYADWNAARLLVPLFGAICVLAVVGFLLFRSLGGDDSAADVVDVAEDDIPIVADEVVEADPQTLAQRRADSFAQALSVGSINTQPFAFETPAEAQADLDAVTENLGPVTMTAVAGPVVMDGELRAEAPLEWTWVLDDGTTFSTVGDLQLVLVGTEWQVDWDPAVVHSSLTPGDTMVRERVTSPRAPILGADGFELVGERPVIEVGVLPRDATSVEAVAQRLASTLGLDQADVADLISRSPSDLVVPITVRRTEAIAGVQAELAAVPGIVLTESTRALTPSDGYGRALLGWAGEVTADILERSPDYFEAGDIVGRSGLQAQYNERLAGLPGFQVRIDRQFALRDDAGQEIAPDADVNIVYLAAPQPPEVVQTTIDNRTQVAAEQALARTELISSLVAVRVSTGEVLAVANGPRAAVDNFALTGRYPPGSIFKVVTAYAALQRGATIDQPIGCPATVVVDGREFRNSQGHDFGTVNLWNAFAQSCNTSFVELGLQLDPSVFPQTAGQLGVGGQYQLGTPAFAGLVPTPGSPVERAATSFGQSTVLVSPLSMAVLAASVASGSYRPPTLVLGQSEPAAPVALDPAVADQLRQMMAGVVNNGTGSAVQGVPGGQVYGKTGTAEFGNDNPPATHAWFMGFQGDIAFAVVVDSGGFGGSVAAPLANDFLTRLNGGQG